MSFAETIKYLESFINYEKIPVYPYKESLKLERIRDFLLTLGNPQDSLSCIQVAGTKGKGSTCAFIAYILRQGGFKVGLYTSPHLSDFRERIRILSPHPAPRTPHPEFEGMISKQELCNLVKRLKPTIQQYNKNSRYGPLTFFEIYTAVAFSYFKAKKTDLVVLETGLGGRLDATNVVDALVAVITPISYEHTQKLGNTLREIATEKAGIIKARVQGSGFRVQPVVISAPQKKEAKTVIRNKCKDIGAMLFEVGRDIAYDRPRTYNPEPRTQKTSIQILGHSYRDLEINLIGAHQWVNAAAAVGAVEALRYHKVKVDVEAIRDGLSNTLWPGRCEVVARNPLVVLDGAQNIASARALKEAIGNNFHYRKLILVLGISSDKDIEGICNVLCPLADEIILTQASSLRAAKAGFIENIIRTPNPSRLSFGSGRDPAFAGEPRTSIIKTTSILEAVKTAQKKASARDLILITGSLFVVGEARELFKQK